MSLLPTNAQVVMKASDPYYYRRTFFLHRHQVRVSAINLLMIRFLLYATGVYHDPSERGSHNLGI
ncbi:hypothetical protein [Adhaeribacter aerolatus]|uniref:hypothetical protein n=1 Tax=Adhaeribacter aerolatus TaxID=670289 RepID=UPI0011BDEDD1|nr:hypothetical protein [Adhaeribacter aerolatus]